jgi:hypothetical protein
MLTWQSGGSSFNMFIIKELQELGLSCGKRDLSLLILTYAFNA